MHELTHIGLDVHKETIAVAVLRPGESECDECVIANTPAALRKLLSRYPDRAALRTCYEAGPTGYDTHRLLSSLGVPCEVIAPSLIPRRSGVRVKTDRSDARNLARLHRAGELTAVRVPSPSEEALRDLVRAREDLKSDRRIARQRIRSFLLRYGRRYPAPGARWSFRFEVWMRALTFEEPAAQAAFDHLVSASSVRDAQLDAIDRQIEEAALCAPLAVPVARLRAFRGIDTLSAVTILTETCDFRRFATAAQLHGLHRARAQRALLRRGPPSGFDHQGRQRARAPRSGRGRLGLPPPAGRARRARQAPRGPAARGRGLLLEGAVPAELDLPQAGGEEESEQGGRRRRPRALRLRLGRDDGAHGRLLKEADASRWRDATRSDPRVRYALPSENARA